MKITKLPFKKMMIICVFMFCIIDTAFAVTDTWLANDNGTVLDVATGLVLQQETDSNRHNYANALIYCQELSLGGSNNWRLPQIKELMSIVDYRTTGPAIDGIDFKGFPSTIHWTTSSDATRSQFAWVVSFSNGAVVTFSKTSENSVRCVR